MKLQTKIWLASGTVIALIMAVDLIYGYRSIDAEIRERLESEARVVRAITMATRRVYHAQFMASGIPLDEHTVGFLPAHAMSRISADFPNWISSGLRFNNVSDRPRNPANQADADELAAMAWFRANPEAKDHEGEIQDSRGAAYYHFTAPIWIEPYCLKCHGDRADAPPTIRDAYAGAYGYKVGDLRGIMSIKLPMDELKAKALSHWWQTFAWRSGGYVVLLILLGSLLQRLITRRLKALEGVARRLEGGDLSARASTEGSDEVTSLARSFNDMADALARHDHQMERLNQIYAALSDTNQTIVRIGNEAELLERVCRIAVEHGGQSLAWIGRPGPTGELEPVCAFGSGMGYLHDIHVSIDPASPWGNGPSAVAWRSNQPVVVQDYFADELTRPWQDRAGAYQWGSCASLPILRGGTVHLLLNLYHKERDAFDARMMALLTEMAMDIGYALDRIDLVARQKQSLADLRESEAKYRNVLATSLDGFWLVDKEGRLLEVNDAYVALSGYTRDELLSMHVSDLEVKESPDEVARHIRQAMSTQGDFFETAHRSKSGQLKPVEISSTYSEQQGGIFSVFIRDLSRRHEAESRILQLSHFDPLTGLPNRTLFADRVTQAIGQAQRNGETLALMFLDLDNFRNVNDTLGHRIGDQLLIGLAQRLQTALRAEDTVSRLGGDEFLFLIPHADAQMAAHVAERLLLAVTAPLAVEANDLTVTSSIGIALYPGDGEDMETLLRRADTATNWAKHEGRNAYRFFAPEMQAHSARTLQLEASLRRALERQELLLHYQPQIDLQTGQLVGVEALLRWKHPTFGLVSPAEFIPLAESSGLILPIGEWVLDQALSDLKGWMNGGYPLSQVAVNLSAVQFRQQNLLATIERLLAESGVPPECLELELTESVTMENPAEAMGVMDALARMGCHAAIDDFGTGYSSLSYLKRFRVDRLKIDQSFVRDLGKDPEDEAIVRAIISLAASLNFKTIAEGVETAEQLEFLKAAGCGEIQGYHISRPLPPEALTAWMEDWAARGDSKV